jgi:23S rRNA (guanosine2251-2'-O)-methyltransferase
VSGGPGKRGEPDPDVILGIHPVYEALVRGERPIERIHLRRGAASGRLRRILEMAESRGIPVRREDTDRLDRESGGRLHQGVMALAGGVLRTVPLSQLLEAPSPLIVVLDHVQDPQNLGAVIRTAETAGATGLVVTARRSAPLSPAVARASAGAVEHVAIHRAGNLVAALREMKGKGIWVVGVDPGGESLWTAFDYRSPVALVLGGEHRGIRRLVRESCDVRVRLPLGGRVESLNVSVAAGIVLFEAVRQRRGL